MSTWNHRVVRTTNQRGNVYYAVHEAHYAEGGNIPDFVTTDPIAVIGDDVASLRWTLERMIAALDNPVIEFVPDPVDAEIGTWREIES